MPFRTAMESRPNVLIFHEAKEEVHINLSKRFVSVEIEVAEKNEEKYQQVINTVAKWKGRIVRDGSLPVTGFEINTAPAAGDFFVREIREICQALQVASARVTAACGLHVHIDARDYSYYDIRRLARTYAQVESALFAMVDQKRRRNHYCLPCADRFVKNIPFDDLPLQELKRRVFEGIYSCGFEGRRYRGYKDSSNRYSALNLHSWFYRGTVECRLFGGTVKSGKIIRWGRIWATMLDWVKAHTDKEVEMLLSGKNPQEALFTILGEASDLREFVLKRTALTRAVTYIET